MVPCWVRGDGRRLRFFEQNIPDHPGSPQTMVRDGPEWSVLVRAGPALYGTGAYDVMIQILPRNRLLIDIFGKLLYLSGLDRYRVVPLHISVYSACNFTKTGPNCLSF